MQQLNELKNLVMQNLQKNGYFSNIRAQIRASVFRTIDGWQTTKKVSPFYSQNAKVQKLTETPQGQNTLQLIKEVFQVYNMENSITILSSEANLKQPAKREILQLKNNLQSLNPKKPLLLQILQKYIKSEKKIDKQKKQSKVQKVVELPAEIQSNQSEEEIEEEIVRNQPQRFGQSQELDNLKVMMQQLIQQNLNSTIIMKKLTDIIFIFYSQIFNTWQIKIKEIYFKSQKLLKIYENLIRKMDF